MEVLEKMRATRAGRGCNFLFLHYSGEPLLGYFQVKAATYHNRSLCGVLSDILEKLLDMTVWLWSTLVGRLVAPKIVAFSSFLAP